MEGLAPRINAREWSKNQTAGRTDGEEQAKRSSPTAVGKSLENESLQRRMAGAIADQITMQLAIYFRRRAVASG